MQIGRSLVERQRGSLELAMWLACAMLAASVARGETVAVFDNSSFVDTSGGLSSESDTVQASLIQLGYTVVTFTGITAADWTAAGQSADLILIPELENGDLNIALTSTARTAISTYVRNGGGFVVMSAQSTRSTALLNAVFGFSLSLSSGVSTTLDTAAAAGTPFAGGPSSLISQNATSSVTRVSLPAGARAFYVTSTVTTVFATDLDSGRVGFMGWDWYDARPLGSRDEGWLTVLGSMVEHVAGGAIATIDVDASDEFPINLFGIDDAAIANPHPFALTAGPLVGRTSGFEMEIALSAGQFEVLPTFGPPGSGADIEIGPALRGGTAGTWQVVPLTGGPGSASLRYAILPPSPATSVLSGNLFTVLDEALSVTGIAQTLSQIGAQLTAEFEFTEPGGDPGRLRIRALLAETIDGVDLDAADETLSPTQIEDVFLYRSSEIAINALGVCNGFPSATGFPSSPNCSADDLFQFDPINDFVALVIGGSSLRAVLAAPNYRIALNPSPLCAASTEIASVSGPLPIAQTQISFTFHPLAADQTSFSLCIYTNGIFEGFRTLQVDTDVDFSSIFLTESPGASFDLTLAPRCFGDLNGDKRINNADVILFRGCFPCQGPGCNLACDANRDGNVNNIDMLQLSRVFGTTCPGF
jgi:hypothetical protein